MPTTRTRPAGAVRAILDAAQDRGLALSVVSCVAGSNGLAVSLTTTPHPTHAEAIALFTVLGAPAPHPWPAAVIVADMPRVVGPVPDLGVVTLSVTVQP